MTQTSGEVMKLNKKYLENKWNIAAQAISLFSFFKYVQNCSSISRNHE